MLTEVIDGYSFFEGSCFSNAIKPGGSVTSSYCVDEEDVVAHTGTQLLFQSFDVPDMWLLHALFWLRFEDEVV